MRLGKDCVRGLPALLLLAGGVTGFSQVAPAPEIRRAIPVLQSETAVPITSAIPVMRAIPVETPPLPPSPVSSPAPTPVPSISPSPEREPPTLPGSASTDDAGSIRLGPSAVSDPMATAKAQLAVADGFYSRKDPASAVPEYEKFLIMATKDHPDREKALYRLGESQRQMGSTAAAEATFASILAVPSASPGPYRPGAAFRLGELRESAGDPSSAAINFAAAATWTTDPTVRQASLYRQAECFEKTGRLKEAEVLFTSLIAPPSPTSGDTEKPRKSGPSNPYLVPVLMHLASNATLSGQKESAVDDYDRILASGATGELRAEALVKSASLLSELGRKQESLKRFAEAAASRDAGTWHGIATLALLRISATSGDDDTILKLSQEAASADQQNRPEILLTRADALRRKGRNTEALSLYDTIIRETPRAPSASKASFQRLLSLHASHSPSLAAEIDRYLLAAADPGDRSRARLLKAEAALAAKDYVGAAVLYGEIDTTALPDSAKPDILYKQAWALLQAGNREGGTKALSLFLTTYPSDERAAAALAQRAMLRQASKDFEGALSDFSLLARNYPKAPERELALQQKALLLGQLQRNGEMAAAFEELLRDYPDSKASAQAHYWRGWVSYEAKDYQKALTELSGARTGDPKQFGERAGLRILLCQYYLGDAKSAAREAAAIKPSLIPPEVGRWLGQKSLDTGDRAAAERFLTPLAKEGQPGSTDSEIQGMLASALSGQGKFKEAQAPAAACLKLARDPASRAKALLVSAEIQRSLKNLSAAQSQIEEAMLLQPEGPINGQARLLSGDILASKQDFEGAAKAYMTVAYLYNDGALVDTALGKVADAYRRAGNTTEEQKAREELRKRQTHAAVSPTPTP